MNATKRATYPLRRGTPYWNEQVKLIAAFFNNLAVAAFTGAFVLPIFTQKILPVVIVLGGLFIAVVCHLVAPAFLREME